MFGCGTEIWVTSIEFDDTRYFPSVVCNLMIMIIIIIIIMCLCYCPQVFPDGWATTMSTMHSICTRCVKL